MKKNEKRARRRRRRRRRKRREIVKRVERDLMCQDHAVTM